MLKRRQSECRGQRAMRAAFGIYFRDERGNAYRPSLRDLKKHGPELFLQRNAGAMTGESEAAFDQAGHVRRALHSTLPSLTVPQDNREVVPIMTAYLVFRAVVADLADRAPFDHWYRTEGLAEALKAWL